MVEAFLKDKEKQESQIQKSFKATTLNPIKYDIEKRKRIERAQYEQLKLQRAVSSILTLLGAGMIVPKCEEGMFVGWSSGSAVHGAVEYAREHSRKDDVMVILLPDHGTRYLNKVYNDQWMKDHGFLEERSFSTAREIIAGRNGKNSLYTISKNSKIGDAIRIMNKEGIDQVPVVDGDEFVGSVAASSLLEKIITIHNRHLINSFFVHQPDGIPDF